MKKRMIITIALLLTVMLAFTGALANGQGGQQQNQEMTETQMMNRGDGQYTQYGLGDPVFININAIQQAISGLDNGDTKTMLQECLNAYQFATAGESLAEEQAALQQLRNALQAAGVQVPGGEPANFSYAYGRECGRFLDIDKVTDTIAMVTDAETSAELAALLDAYRQALDQNDPQAVREALEALMNGLLEAQIDVDGYTGLQLFKATQGLYLDTIAVEAAIAALEDPDTVESLLALLDTYMMAANGGGTLAAQEALSALMSALNAAGI